MQCQTDVTMTTMIEDLEGILIEDHQTEEVVITMTTTMMTEDHQDHQEAGVLQVEVPADDLITIMIMIIEEDPETQADLHQDKAQEADLRKRRAVSLSYV